MAAQAALRILQITALANMRSGGAVQMYTLARELARRGHHVTAVYRDEPRFRDDFACFEGSGVDLRFLPLGKVRLRMSSVRSVMNLRRILASGDFDIVHCHKGTAVDLVWTASLGLGIPIVTNRGVISPVSYTQGLKYRTSRIRRIVAVSRAVKEVMARTGRIDPAKIEVVYGSVDADAFRPAIPSTIRREFGISNDAVVIGYVGSALRRKGLEHLLAAFADVHGKRPETVLLLVGVSREALDALDTPPCPREAVVCTGFRTDVPNCMAGMDVFAFPGVADEGLTGTVREAAAMALPVVTTDVAGNTELIVDGVSGFVVPMRDASAMAAAIERCIDDPVEARRLGARARGTVLASMTIGTRTDRIEAIYRDILDR